MFLSDLGQSHVQGEEEQLLCRIGENVVKHITDKYSGGVLDMQWLAKFD